MDTHKQKKLNFPQSAYLKPENKRCKKSQVRVLRSNSNRKGENSSFFLDSGLMSPSFQAESLLSPESLKEIQRFKEEKVQEYQKTLEKCLSASVPAYLALKREKIRISNEKAKKKHLEIVRKKESEEILRLKQGQKLKIKELEYLASKKQEKLMKKQALTESITKKKEVKEKEAKMSQQKNLVIESIKNFYSDRIQELKEKIKQERFENKQIFNDQKSLDSVLRSLRKNSDSQST